MASEGAARPSGGLTPAVVLVRPREEGNVGAAARAMANMGLERLVLVEPAAEIGKVALAFAVGARAVLDGCMRAASLEEALAPFRRIVATTSTRDRRLGVPLLAPRELPGALARDARDAPDTRDADFSSVALVFGPEVGGLTTEELSRASLVVAVPCSPVQPTLNLSQTVLILAYELYQARLAGGLGAVVATSGAVAPPAASATSGDIDGLFADLRGVLARIGFERDATFPGVLRDLRRLAARAAPTTREVTILRGICRRARHALDRTPGGPAAD